jgi:hypothetical protein
VNTGGLNGCYWVRVLKKLPNGNLLIENMHDVGKIKVQPVQTTIESGLVYRLVRGRDIARWRAQPSADVILAQDPDTGKGVAESRMRKEYPKTYAYFKAFEGDPAHAARGTLRARALYKLYFKPTDPFYSMYNVGPYSLAKWKVVWTGQVATALNCAVLRPDESDGRPVLLDQTAYFVPFTTLEEALYFAAVMNSTAVRAFYKMLAYKHASMHFMQLLRIEPFRRGDKTQERLAESAAAAQIAAREEKLAELEQIEKQIDMLACKRWRIGEEELHALQAEIRSGAEEADNLSDDDS